MKSEPNETVPNGQETRSNVVRITIGKTEMEKFGSCSEHYLNEFHRRKTVPVFPLFFNMFFAQMRHVLGSELHLNLVDPSSNKVHRPSCRFVTRGGLVEMFR